MNPQMSHYARILRVARSGAPDRAWEMLADSGLLKKKGEARALTLKGRLLKDRARRAPADQRAMLFGEAAAAYLRAHQVDKASYPLINAATLTLLAKDAVRSRELAQQTLDLLDGNPAEAETAYWLGATRAEAHLLLGDGDTAQAAMRDAVAQAPKAWEDHAATIGQFELLAEVLDANIDWLDSLRPPRAVHFSGIMGIASHNETLQFKVADWLEAEDVGFGFGALAAGADIVVAEALIARGGELNVLLPCDAATFRERSVIAVDPSWGARFDALLERAESVESLHTATAPTPEAVDISEAVAAGRAIHLARTLRSEALELRVEAREESSNATDFPWGRRLRQAVFTTERIASRDIAAIDSSVDKAALVAVACGQTSRVAIKSYDDLQSAWAYACSAIGEGQTIGLHYGVGKSDPDRAQALLAASAPGQIIASEAAAFSLLSEIADVDVQPIGELRSAFGIEVIHMVTPLSDDHILEHTPG